MGSAAAGAVVLGTVAGATALVPKVAASGVKAATPIPVAAQGSAVGIPSSWDYAADVVVVGYGVAGASAAITAHDAGASVIILEKSPHADSGNSGVCGGLSWFPVLSSNGGSIEDFITYMKVSQWGTVADDDLITAFCTGIANLPAWFTSLGAKTTFVTSNCAVPRALVTGLVSPSFQSVANWTNYLRVLTPTGAAGAGVDDMVFLQGCVNARNIPVKLATPAQRLIQNPVTKEVVGVQAVDWKGETLYVQANKGVILACGGYENNQEMRTNFLPWANSNEPFITFGGTPYNTGDGIIMAQSVGAKLWHMNNKEWGGTTYASKAASKELGMGVSISATGGNFAIIVNKFGLRFMNEHIYSSHTAQLLPTEQLVELNSLQPVQAPFSPQYSYLPSDYVDYPNIPYYAVFDSTLMKTGPLHSGGWPGLVSALHPAGTQVYTWSSDNSAELARGWILTGKDPTTLGNNIVSYDNFGRVVGMNATNLAATITQYNTDCAAGKGDTVFGRPASTMVALTNPPYYAIELCVAPLNTNGGPVHDQYGRTIDVYSNPIPRLYSIGELGSIFGYLYYGGGNFPEGMVMGQYAGKHAASLPSLAMP